MGEDFPFLLDDDGLDVLFDGEGEEAEMWSVLGGRYTTDPSLAVYQPSYIDQDFAPHISAGESLLNDGGGGDYMNTGPGLMRRGSTPGPTIGRMSAEMMQDPSNKVKNRPRSRPSSQVCIHTYDDVLSSKTCSLHPLLSPTIRRHLSQLVFPMVVALREKVMNGLFVFPYVVIVYLN